MRCEIKDCGFENIPAAKYCARCGSRTVAARSGGSFLKHGSANPSRRVMIALWSAGLLMYAFAETYSTGNPKAWAVAMLTRGVLWTLLLLVLFPFSRISYMPLVSFIVMGDGLLVLAAVFSAHQLVQPTVACVSDVYVRAAWLKAIPVNQMRGTPEGDMEADHIVLAELLKPFMDSDPQSFYINSLKDSAAELQVRSSSDFGPLTQGSQLLRINRFLQAVGSAKRLKAWELNSPVLGQSGAISSRVPILGVTYQFYVLQRVYVAANRMNGKDDRADDLKLIADYLEKNVLRARGSL